MILKYFITLLVCFAVSIESVSSSGNYYKRSDGDDSEGVSSTHLEHCAKKNKDCKKVYKNKCMVAYASSEGYSQDTVEFYSCLCSSNMKFWKEYYDCTKCISKKDYKVIKSPKRFKKEICKVAKELKKSYSQMATLTDDYYESNYKRAAVPTSEVFNYDHLTAAFGFAYGDIKLAGNTSNSSTTSSMASITTHESANGSGMFGPSFAVLAAAMMNLV